MLRLGSKTKSVRLKVPSERAINAVASEPLRLKIEAAFDALDHGLGDGNLCNAIGACSLGVDDDPDLVVDEIVCVVSKEWIGALPCNPRRLWIGQRDLLRRPASAATIRAGNGCFATDSVWNRTVATTVTGTRRSAQNRSSHPSPRCAVTHSRTAAANAIGSFTGASSEVSNSCSVVRSIEQTPREFGWSGSVRRDLVGQRVLVPLINESPSVMRLRDAVFWSDAAIPRCPISMACPSKSEAARRWACLALSLPRR
jgi:hypothetical protein